MMHKKAGEPQNKTGERYVFIKSSLGLTEGTETMLAQEQRLNQIANNLANVNTTGYKKDNLTFGEMMFKAADNRMRVGKELNVITDQTQGAAIQTGNPLDFEINGRGFFKIQTPAGIRYTRNGNFTLNSAGQLSTADGNLVIGSGGPIVLDNDQIAVARDGQISAGGQIINKLSLVDFSGTNSLEKEGNNLFKLKPGSAREQAATSPNIQQGALEGSNVNIIKGMTEMIDLQRSYQSQQKAIQTLDDLDHQSISRVGNLTG
jgi:flagellar basal-body rod protein FlgG